MYMVIQNVTEQLVQYLTANNEKPTKIVMNINNVELIIKELDASMFVPKPLLESMPLNIPPYQLPTSKDPVLYLLGMRVIRTNDIEQNEYYFL